MTTDRFSKEQFEDALPVNQRTGNKLWEWLEFKDGEEVYAVPIPRKDGEKVRIVIRSSVGRSGFAAETGEDSIRCWLEAADVEELESVGFIKNTTTTWQAVGKDDTRWTTRVPGWARRLTGREIDGRLNPDWDDKAVLRRLWRLGRYVIKRCPDCDRWLHLLRSKKQDTKGWLFLKCDNCGRWDSWVPRKHEEGK